MNPNRTNTTKQLGKSQQQRKEHAEREQEDIYNETPKKAKPDSENTSTKMNKKNKSISYGKRFDSTKGYPGEGPEMKLNAKLFQCPTIMGKRMVEVLMNKKKATNTIKQLQITQTAINNQKDNGEQIEPHNHKTCHTESNAVKEAYLKDINKIHREYRINNTFDSTKGYPGEGPETDNTRNKKQEKITKRPATQSNTKHKTHPSINTNRNAGAIEKVNISSITKNNTKSKVNTKTKTRRCKSKTRS